jgi:integrase
LSQWLGHASYTLTLDRYGDSIPEQDGGAPNNRPEATAPNPPTKVDNVVSLFVRQSG